MWVLSISSLVSAVPSSKVAWRVWCGWGSRTITSLLWVWQSIASMSFTWGGTGQGQLVCDTLYYTSLCNRQTQIGEEDDFSSLCACFVYALYARMHVHVCIFGLCMHVHACTTDHTTHSLTRFIDSGVFIPDSVVECGEHHHLKSSQISMAFCTFVSLSRTSWGIVGYH